VQIYVGGIKMPTNTFFNLPESKRNKVVQAAKEEFLRSKNGDIVIKNIVIKAGIPRGSFYQYFESKEDVVAYLMENHLSETRDDFCKKLEECEGDILIAFEKIFYNIISGKNRERLNIEKKIIEQANKFREKTIISPKCIQPLKLAKEGKMLQYLNKAKYRIDTSEELETIFCILMGIMSKNIVDFQNGESEEQVLCSFKRDLDYLKYGIKK